MKSRVDLARNAIKTIVNGSNLIALVNQGSSSYALVMNSEMPGLKTIYDGAMYAVFSDLAARLRE